MGHTQRTKHSQRAVAHDGYLFDVHFDLARFHKVNITVGDNAQKFAVQLPALCR